MGFSPEDEIASLEAPSLESVTYADYDDPFALVRECCGTTPIIHQLSPLVWVSVSKGIYVLECVGAGFIRVEPLKDTEGGFPALPCASRGLPQKPRAGSQVPSASYPGNVGQSHS